nr:Uncharacterised protein [Ipomoea batatas]
MRTLLLAVTHISQSCSPTEILEDAVTVVIVVILGGLSLEVTLILAYSMKGMMSDKAIAMRHACLRLQLFVRNRTVATEAKLSSRITISELSLATSVPWIPIESPISASFKAGASLVPSPVTATMWPFFLRHCTIRSLSNGEDLAITQIFSTLSILCSSVSEDVISSDHLDVYTSILAIFHSFLHTSSTWVFEANKPQKGQATLCKSKSHGQGQSFWDCDDYYCNSSSNDSHHRVNHIISLCLAAIELFIPIIILGSKLVEPHLEGRLLTRTATDFAHHLAPSCVHSNRDITRKTARKILPPSYHPSFAPSSFMPNARDNTAHTKSMMMVGSLNISQTNWNKPFVGGLG